MKKALFIMALVAVVFATGCKKKETYTVTFDANGGTGTMEAQVFTEGVAQTLTANAFTYEYHLFVKWNTLADGSGTSFSDGQKITAPFNMTLYAQWSMETYTVTFNANGGSGEMQPQTFTREEPQAIAANTFVRDNYWFLGWNTSADGTGTAYTPDQTVTMTGDITLYAQWSCGVTGETGGHNYVDLGLPSGKLWATCNIGASSPTDYGDYFAWGEIEQKATYSWDNYKYAVYHGAVYFTKYCSDPNMGYNGFTDTLTVLLPEDDAAIANWGAGWRMPTKTEMQELKDDCTVTWSTQQGINGLLFTGHNGNSLFLPAAGYCLGDDLYDVGSVNYLSSSLQISIPASAWFLYIQDGDATVYVTDRCLGLPVRPVYPASKK